MEGLLGLALIVGLSVAYAVQRRGARGSTELPPAPAAESATDSVGQVAGEVTVRSSSPAWAAPILYCGLLVAAATQRDAWWGVLWQVLYFGLIVLAAYSTFSAKEFANEKRRDPALTRREHLVKLGVPYLAVPAIAWVLAIPVGWMPATLLPAVPWALLLLIGLGAALFGKARQP